MWFFFSSRCCVTEEGNHIRGFCYDNEEECIVICRTTGSPWSKACAAFLLTYLFITLMQSSRKTDDDNKIFFKTFRNDLYVKVVIIYDLCIDITVSVITYILFVSNSAPTDLLINTVAVTFLTEIDEFLAFTIQKDLTVSIIREYIFS
jgi:hypothetical protein